MATSRDAQMYCCGANKEVILSAGTVGTPQLLLLSGVGPAEDLENLGITVVKDMPAVGRHVIDVRPSFPRSILRRDADAYGFCGFVNTLQHVSSGPIPFRMKPSLTYDFLRDATARSLAFLKWQFCGTGPLASLVYSSTAFVRSTDPRCVSFSLSPSLPPSPVYHTITQTHLLTFASCRLPFYANGRSGAPVNDRSSGPGAPDLEIEWVPQAVFADGFQRPRLSTSGVTFAAVALKPESRGRITLKSTDPFDTPNIDPQCVPSLASFSVSNQS